MLIHGSAEHFGATVLPPDGRGVRPPGVRVPGQYRLALVGQRHRVDGPPGLGGSGAARAEHRFQQFAGILFDAAAVEIPWMHRHLGQTDNTVVGIDHDGLCPRRCLGLWRVRSTRYTVEIVEFRIDRVAEVHQPDDRHHHDRHLPAAEAESRTKRQLTTGGDVHVNRNCARTRYTRCEIAVTSWSP